MSTQIVRRVANLRKECRERLKAKEEDVAQLVEKIQAVLGPSDHPVDWCLEKLLSHTGDVNAIVNLALSDNTPAGEVKEIASTPPIASPKKSTPKKGKAQEEGGTGREKQTTKKSSTEKAATPQKRAKTPVKAETPRPTKKVKKATNNTMEETEKGSTKKKTSANKTTKEKLPPSETDKSGSKKKKPVPVKKIPLAKKTTKKASEKNPTAKKPSGTKTKTTTKEVKAIEESKRKGKKDTTKEVEANKESKRKGKKNKKDEVVVETKNDDVEMKKEETQETPKKPNRLEDFGKRPLSAFLHFSKEIRPKLVLAVPEASTRLILEAANTAWGLLPDDLKKTYEDMAANDREELRLEKEKKGAKTPEKKGPAAEKATGRQAKRSKNEPEKITVEETERDKDKENPRESEEAVRRDHTDTEKERQEERPKETEKERQEDDDDMEPKKEEIAGKKKLVEKRRRPLSAFMIYAQSVRAEKRRQHPEASFGELGKMIAVDWSELTDQQKAQYVKAAAGDPSLSHGLLGPHAPADYCIPDAPKSPKETPEFR